VATQLRFPRGSSRSYLLTFLRPDGDPEDLTGATFAAYIKASVFDADADALVDISARLTVLDAAAGEAVLALEPDDTADLDAWSAKEWEARATLSDGRVVVREAHRGALVFSPLTGGPDAVLPPGDEIAEYSAGDAGSGASVSDITGLTGGASTDLDGLSAARLAGLPVGTVIELFFTGSVAVRYRRRLRSPADETEVGAAAGGFKIICDNATTTLWELVSVTKQGVPCLWNADTVKWHQVVGSATGTGVSAATAQEADAFSLPA